VSNFDQTTADAGWAVARDVQRGSDFNAVLLAMAAHDLRQPLQVILSGYSLLTGRRADEHEKTFIEHGKLAIRQMIDQLDHLVDALRIHERAAGLKLAPVDVQALFATLQSENATTAVRCGIELHIAPTIATVMSDAVLLESILRNLVRNALKYTPRGGRILVGCRRQVSQFRIEVHDTGVGIRSYDLAQIFEAFHRLDSAASDGLGLGLFVVRRAADLLGHRIEVRSEIGHGSCFSLLLSAAVAETPGLPALGTPASVAPSHTKT
jgi:signal transduction histidine kinase